MISRNSIEKNEENSSNFAQLSLTVSEKSAYSFGSCVELLTLSFPWLCNMHRDTSHIPVELEEVGKLSYSRILKANSSWSPTWAKFCQLIASLSVVVSQLNLTKLKLEYLKFGF